MLDHVFSPITINGMELKNRMVVTPMVTDYCNEDGTATEKWLAYHEEKAKGGFGLIITVPVPGLASCSEGIDHIKHLS